MRGSVRKDGSTWCYTVDIGKKPDGRRIKKKKRGFKTKKEAQIALNQLLNDLNKGKFISTAKYTYSEFLDIWLKHMEPALAVNTFSTYSQVVRLHIKPILGHYLLEELNPRLIDEFNSDLYKKKVLIVKKSKEDEKSKKEEKPKEEEEKPEEPKNLKNNSIRKIIAVLKNSLNFAVKHDYISISPARDIKKPSENLVTKIKWTDKDIRSFLAVAKDSVYYPAYLLAIFCGLRRGEILGISWTEIYFTQQKLEVINVLGPDNKTIIMKPKTKGSQRNVAISTEILLELKRIKEQHSKFNNLFKEYNLVVPNELGKPVNPRNLLRNMAILIKKADVPKITFHDFRHIHASLLLKQNIHMKVVSERLGHTKISTTMDRYTHLAPSLQSEAAESLNYLWEDSIEEDQ